MGRITPCRILMKRKCKQLSCQNMTLGDRPGGATRSGITLSINMKRANGFIKDRNAEVCCKVSRFLL